MKLKSDKKSMLFESKNFFKNAIEAYIDILIKADAKFNASQNLYQNKIIDKKTYNYPNILRYYKFGFVELANEIKNQINVEVKKIEATYKGNRSVIDTLTNDVYKKAALNYIFDERSDYREHIASMKSIEFFPNEIVSFFIRFDAWAQGWVGIRPSKRMYSKVNYNDLQSAKTMEMILFCTLSPLMMHMATNLQEKHDSMIVMLNYMTHEITARKELGIIRRIMRHVPIVFNKDGRRHEFTIETYNKILSRELKQSIKGKEGYESFKKVINSYRIAKIVRRCKGKIFETNLTHYIDLCLENNIYFTMIYDESQNAANKDSTMHKQVQKYIEKFDDREKYPHIRREYWTATPAQHNGTFTHRCFGVLGHQHTGIHCLENCYLKRIDGLYFDKCTNNRPNLISLESIYRHLNIGTKNFYIEKAYKNESNFISRRTIFVKNGVIPPSIVTHKQYVTHVHECFAKLIEYFAANNQKTSHDQNVIQNNLPMIALRFARCNDVLNHIISGINRHLTNPNQYHLETFNSKTRVSGRTNRDKKAFNLKKWIVNEFAPSHNNKSLVLFFTGMGRCGDRFPRDFRTFIDFSRGKDITVLSQGFYGRSCGYFKDNPWVLLHDEQANIIKNFINNHGIPPKNATQKGTEKLNGLSGTYKVRDYPFLRPIVDELMVILDNTARKDSLQGRYNINEVPRHIFDRIISLLNQHGENLANINDKDYLFDLKRHQNPVAMKYDISANSMIKIRNRMERKDIDTNAGGTTPQNQDTRRGLFVPSIIWSTRHNDRRYKQKIFEFNLMLKGSYIKDTKSNSVNPIPINVSNPKKSAYPHIDRKPR